MYHQAKKRFGQHFLKDNNIAERICRALPGFEEPEAKALFKNVLEVGPGLGVLTRILYPRYGTQLHLAEIDKDLVPDLKKDFPLIAGQVHEVDFLDFDMQSVFKDQVAVIGNFPYNISSQILFKMVENHAIVPQMVGMFQREVAQRVVAGPGTKVYGLLSAWVQAFYDTEYLFTVNEGSFTPPPKVKSGVIRLNRKGQMPDCDEKFLLQVIKAAFGTRRKTLRNALGSFKSQFGNILDQSILDKRAEQLHYTDYIMLAQVLKV